MTSQIDDSEQKQTHKEKGLGLNTSSMESSEDFDPKHLALPEEEIRQLVLQITSAGNIEKLLRAMVVLLDDFEAGRADKLTEVAGQSSEPSYQHLMSAIGVAAEEARLVAARNTVFYAANYAFQRSRVYAYALMTCLDSLRDNPDSRGSNTP